MSAVPQPYSLPKASDRILAELRRLILTGECQAGDRLLSEAELMATFGGSRAAVREALRLLEVEGLVQLKRGRTGGTIVIHPETSTIGRSLANILTLRRISLGDFIAFRRILEPAIAAAAARNATPEQAACLAALATEESSLPTCGLDAATADFHTSIGQCSGNDMYAVVLESLSFALEAHIRLDAVTRSDVMSTQSAHLKIAKAIAAGNADGAHRAMDRHLAALESFLREIGQLEAPVIPQRGMTGRSE